MKPFIQPTSFTGAGAVSQLVKILDEFGINEVDVAIRLEILTKIRDNAGNHYFRAWVDNLVAMEVVREWLKLAFVGRSDSQLVETIMPILHVSGGIKGASPFVIVGLLMRASQIIDRLPLTIEKLKLSKLGKLIMRLMKDPPTPGELNSRLSAYYTYTRFALLEFPIRTKKSDSRAWCARNSCSRGVAHEATVIKYMYLTAVFACAAVGTISDQGHGIEPGTKVAENAVAGGVRQDGH